MKKLLSGLVSGLLFLCVNISGVLWLVVLLMWKLGMFLGSFCCLIWL